MPKKKSNLTEEVKKALIEKHGKENLRVIQLPIDDSETEFLDVLVKVPSRSTVNQFMRFIDTLPKKAQEVLINQCLLTSKDEVMADDHLFLTAIAGISELFPIRNARVKKL